MTSLDFIVCVIVASTGLTVGYMLGWNFGEKRGGADQWVRGYFAAINAAKLDQRRNRDRLGRFARKDGAP